MFYFESLNGYKVLKSDLINDITAFFTTREGFDFNTLNASRVVSPVQTHSDNIKIVSGKEEYPDTDALILKDKNTAVYLKFADCTPLIFYDKKLKISAIAHAGWRGTAQKIGVKTIEKMQKDFGTYPQDITALIGPAISLCCYEVSEEVKETLLSTVSDRAGLYKERNVDLKKINARQLEEQGVKNIDICPYCTSCNNDLFFSYRKENGTKDRHMAVVML